MKIRTLLSFHARRKYKMGLFIHQRTSPTTGSHLSQKRWCASIGKLKFKNRLWKLNVQNLKFPKVTKLCFWRKRQKFVHVPILLDPVRHNLTQCDSAWHKDRLEFCLYLCCFEQIKLQYKHKTIQRVLHGVHKCLVQIDKEKLIDYYHVCFCLLLAVDFTIREWYIRDLHHWVLVTFFLFVSDICPLLQRTFTFPGFSWNYLSM